jgi:hypothetical protein
MARVLITVNFNDDTTPSPFPTGIPTLPAVPSPVLPATGGEINAAQLTDDNFDGTAGSATVAGPVALKRYGIPAATAAPTEGRFLRRRLMGFC